MGFIKYNDQTTATMTAMVKEKLKTDEIPHELKGKNPKIFKYQFFEPDQFGLIAMVMNFYEGTEVFVSYKPKDAKEPFDLALSLIHSGINTHVKIGDKTFEFNQK
ncbi:hypothetical protein D3C85_1010010 [compost metagenome]